MIPSGCDFDKNVNPGVIDNSNNFKGLQRPDNKIVKFMRNLLKLFTFPVPPVRPRARFHIGRNLPPLPVPGTPPPARARDSRLRANRVRVTVMWECFKYSTATCNATLLQGYYSTTIAPLQRKVTLTFPGTTTAIQRHSRAYIGLKWSELENA